MKKKRKLKNLVVTHVSYVDRGANQKKFYLTKEFEDKKDKPNFQARVRLICSENEEERKIYGIVYEPDTADAHGDYCDAKTLEKAAEDYMENYQKMDEQHKLIEGQGVVVQSFIAPVDFSVNGEDIKKGTWVLVSKATPEIWEKTKSGDITGYSLYGTAEMEYERISIGDLFSYIFKSKDSIVQLNNMEVVMDEELKKALEALGNVDNSVKELVKNLSKENLEVIFKSLVEDLVKKALEDFISSDVKKSNDSKMETIEKGVSDLSKKLDDVIEGLQNRTTLTKTQEDNKEVVTSKSNFVD